MLRVKLVRGDEKDVLSRFVLVLEQTNANIIVRITGDCPLIDPKLISKTIKKFRAENVEYLSNSYPPTYPDGLDVEVFTRESLNIANKECKDPKMREHVTQWIRDSGKFKINTLKNLKNYSNLRWTVDEPEDLKLIRKIVKYFDYKSDFSWEDVLRLIEKNPNLTLINSKFKRNEGSNMSTGKKLWESEE